MPLFDISNSVTRTLPQASKQIIEMQNPSDAELAAPRGRDVIESLGGGASLDLHRVTRAVSKLRDEDVPVPAGLAAAIDNVDRASKLSPEPPLPDVKLVGKKFDDAMSAWLVDHATWMAGKETRHILFRKLVVTAQDAMQRGTDEVLAAVSERFASAAAEYTEAHRHLTGLHSIADAANADTDGRAVAFWHARTRCYRVMKVCEDIVKPFVSLSVASYTEWERLALVSPMSGRYHAVTHSDARALFDDDRMYRAVLDNGQQIRLAGSRGEFAARVNQVVEDDDE